MRARSATTLATIIVVAITVLAPATAQAVEAVPDEVVDPPSAIPGIQDQPAPAADAPAGGQDAQAQALPAGPAGERAAVPAPGGVPAPTAVAGVSAAPSLSHAPTSGSLPFTGIDDGQLHLLFLVGSLLLAGGSVAWSYGRTIPAA